MRIKLCCPNCGSENVVRDAIGEWDVDTQSWVIRNVFDNGSCDDCEYETKMFDEVPIDSPEPGVVEVHV